MELNKIISLQLISVPWMNATADYAIKTSQCLNTNGHESIIAAKENTPPINIAKKEAINIFNQIDFRNQNPLILLKSLQALQYFIKNNEIHLINVHRPEDHLFCSWIKTMYPQVPLVRTVGDVRPPKNNIINKWLHLKKTDFFIFSAVANLNRYMNTWPIPKEKTAVIYLPIDTVSFNPNYISALTREKLNVPNDSVIFGQISRLSPVKDHETFLKAAEILLRDHTNAYFIISGADVEISKSDLIKSAKEMGIINNLRFLERQADVRDIIKLIDVNVITSKGSEAICRIAAESMAMEKPVIGSNINVIPEMINPGENGFIFEAGNASELAQKMKIFIETPERIKLFGNNAHNLAAARYSFSVFYQNIVQIYQSLLTN